MYTITKPLKWIDLSPEDLATMKQIVADAGVDWAILAPIYATALDINDDGTEGECRIILVIKPSTTYSIPVDRMSLPESIRPVVPEPPTEEEPPPVEPTA